MGAFAFKLTHQFWLVWNVWINFDDTKRITDKHRTKFHIYHPLHPLHHPLLHCHNLHDNRNLHDHYFHTLRLYHHHYHHPLYQHHHHLQLHHYHTKELTMAVMPSHLESPPDVVVPDLLVDGPDEVCRWELSSLLHWESLRLVAYDKVCSHDKDKGCGRLQ